MKNKFLLVGLLALVLSFGSGCALFIVGAAGAGVGAVYYHKGELRSAEATSFDNALTATLAALKDLDYAFMSQTRDGLNAKITARAPGDKKVTVSLEKQSGTVTQIGVRIDVFGDGTQARLVLDTIKKHL